MIAALTIMIVLGYSNLQVTFPQEAWGIVGVLSIVQLWWTVWKDK